MLNKSLAGLSQKQKAEIKSEIENIGVIIQEKRKGLGLTQEQLAEKLEISYQTIKYIEQGGRVPSLAMLLRILNQLKLKLVIQEK